MMGIGGGVSDTHAHAAFDEPYCADSFSASQVYFFHCQLCMDPNEGELLMNVGDIDRSVYWDNIFECWAYSIEKSGYEHSCALP